jgi:hypothetical protein
MACIPVAGFYHVVCYFVFLKGGGGGKKKLFVSDFPQ